MSATVHEFNYPSWIMPRTLLSETHWLVRKGLASAIWESIRWDFTLNLNEKTCESPTDTILALVLE